MNTSDCPRLIRPASVNISGNVFLAHLPRKPLSFTPVNGSDPDPEHACAVLGEIIRKYPIDIAFIGIGENGHIAFNDPPADFETEKPYLVITLDEACRRQQLGKAGSPRSTMCRNRPFP